MPQQLSLPLSRLKWTLVEYRRPILWALGIFFFVYSYFIFNFIFGNHDWGMVFKPYSWSAKAWQSRPFALIPLQLSQGFYLPVLTPVISLFAYFGAGVLFLALFTGDISNRRVFFLTLLLFLLYPTLLGRIYYEGAGIGENVALFCFLLGVNCALYCKGILSFFICVMLFTFSLGVNQCIINSFWTIFLIIVLYYINNKYNILNICVRRYCGGFLVALCIYLVFIKIIIPDTNNYNNQIGTLKAVFENLLPQLKASLGYFWQAQPPMNVFFKALFTLICIGGFWKLITCADISIHKQVILYLSPAARRAIRIILILLLIMTNNVSAYVSGLETASTFNLRIDYYSIPFILSFCAFAALEFRGLRGHLFTAAAVLLVVLSMGSDVRALQVWKISIDDDILYANRMLARIEAAPEFDAGRSWRMLALGERPVFSRRFYSGYKHTSLELQRPMHLGGYNFAHVFNYIAPNLNISNFWGDAKKVCAQNRDFLDTAPAWPKPGSLRIDSEQGLILVVLDTAAARRYCPR